tara:strand:- start:3633 stop:4325 length:693 start_codon:yes stop_codon:yes gene_type:complete
MEVSYQSEHEALTKVAATQNCTDPVLCDAVSRHLLPETVSFKNIEALRSATTKGNCFVGTLAKDLAFSVEFEEPEDADCDLPPKKRRRQSDAEDQAERVAAARGRLAKAMPDLPAAELDIAEKVLIKTVNALRGSEGEVCLQSYALLGKKLRDSDPRPRVVIAARLNAGISIPVALLKTCMGECWADGLLTTLESIQGISEIDLPLSDEATTAQHYGNASLMLVTSVASR